MSAGHDEAILLIGHGSKDPVSVQEFIAFGQAFARRLGRFVQPAFLEFNEPAIPAAIQRCIAAGARRIVVLPLFLGAATHQKNDVPTAIRWARAQFPGVAFSYGAPLGAHALVAEALAVRALAALPPAAGEAADLGDAAVLLVGRGSRDPDSNSELYKVGRLLHEGREFGWVECCFIAISRPDLPGGLDRCLRLGARRVIVVPHMLFAGVLTRRTERLARQFSSRHREVALAVAAPLGAEEHLLAVAEQRVEEARAGAAGANCDACKYRVPMTGFLGEWRLAQGSDHYHGLRGTTALSETNGALHRDHDHLHDDSGLPGSRTSM